MFEMMHPTYRYTISELSHNLIHRNPICFNKCLLYRHHHFNMNEVELMSFFY